MKPQVINSSVLDAIKRKIDPSRELRIEKAMRFAKVLNDARLKKGFSNVDLANEMGVSKSLVTRWLSGTQNFTLETIFKLEEVLDVELVNCNDCTANFSSTKIIIDWVSVISSLQQQNPIGQPKQQTIIHGLVTRFGQSSESGIA
ncbi:MAG: helix-turn-helix domain-containing protein [Bacteroidetes bacterium]|nr:helix-turn-helix domain-containing protein [Bacteroidota bacterium]